jgi:hypothetical protein
VDDRVVEFFGAFEERFTRFAIAALYGVDALNRELSRVGNLDLRIPG